jgi:hypothetical protein
MEKIETILDSHKTENYLCRLESLLRFSRLMTDNRQAEAEGEFLTLGCDIIYLLDNIDMFKDYLELVLEAHDNS